MPTLIQRLNEAYASNPSPDAVAASLRHPFSVLRSFKSVTSEEYKKYGKIPISIYNPPCPSNNNKPTLNGHGYTLSMFSRPFNSLDNYLIIATEFDDGNFK